MYCRSYSSLYGLEQTILRFGIPYGPRARPAAVVPAFVARAARGDALTIAGDGRQTRQFVYVEDLADGVVAGLAPAAAGRTYNLVGDGGDERPRDRRRRARGRRDGADRPRRGAAGGRPPRLDLRARALRRELGWTADTTFAEGVRRYVDWLTVTNGSPVAAAASSTAGSAAAVFRQEPAEL